MPINKLTDNAVKALKPTAAPYKVADGGGLFLLVNPIKLPSLPSGSKLWRMKYRFGGKEKQLSFGAYDEVSLKEARRLRDAAKETLRDGRDPGLSKKTLADSAPPTFETIAREWHEKNQGRWDKGHAEDVLWSLKRLTFPAIGTTPIGELDAPLVYDLLQRIARENGGDTAKRIRQRMSAVFVEAIARGLRKDDPAAAIKGALAPVKKGQMPGVVNIEDARDVLAKVDAMPARAVTKLAHRLMALTIVRPDNINSARWSEFSLEGDKPEWIIPAEKMKMKLEHVVPLSKQAVAVLEAIKPLTGRSPYVFPNDRWLHRPASENMMNVALRRAGLLGVHCPHGWRVTFSSVMNELYPNDGDAIERVLAHVETNKVRGAYNRAVYLERRRELLAEWATLLLKDSAPLDSLVFGKSRPVKASDSEG
jgi:integrase